MYTKTLFSCAHNPLGVTVPPEPRVEGLPVAELVAPHCGQLLGDQGAVHCDARGVDASGKLILSVTNVQVEAATPAAFGQQPGGVLQEGLAPKSAVRLNQKDRADGKLEADESQHWAVHAPCQQPGLREAGQRDCQSLRKAKPSGGVAELQVCWWATPSLE